MRVLLLAALAAASFGCATVVPAERAVPPPAEGGGDIPDGRPVVTYSPATAPRAVDAASGLNVRANQDASGRNQNETTIAVSPVDPNVVIGGANDARLGRWASGYFRSADGGATWADGVMPFQKYASQGDPTVAFCGDGTAVFGYLDYNGAYMPARLIVARSTDGGATWLGPGVVQESSGFPFADKPYIACAPAGTGVYANRAYVSWTNFGAGSSPIRVAYSTDRGQTWTGAQNVSGNGVQGSVPVAGTRGVVYVFWLGPSGIEFNKSANGGGAWAGAKPVSGVTGIGDDPAFRRNSFPTAGIDNSTGPYANSVYVAWADGRSGDADILLARSSDGGVTWSAPARVNDDPAGNGRDQFFPWMAVDEDGLVHLMWLDRRHDPEDRRFHVYIATSRDGGATFDRNRQVSDVESNSALTNFLGDYSGLAAGGARIMPLWSDLRAGTGEEDAYFQSEQAFAYDDVAGLRFRADRVTLDFDDQEPRLGSDVVYDVVRGDVADLADAGRAGLSACAAQNLGAPPALLPDVPAAGHATYYLLRAEGPRGAGGHGAGTGHPNPRGAYDDAPPCGD